MSTGSIARTTSTGCTHLPDRRIRPDRNGIDVIDLLMKKPRNRVSQVTFMACGSCLVTVNLPQDISTHHDVHSGRRTRYRVAAYFAENRAIHNGKEEDDERRGP